MLAVADAGTADRSDRDRVTLARDLVDKALTVARRVYLVLPPDQPRSTALTPYAVSAGAGLVTSHELAGLMLAGSYPRHAVLVVPQSERPDFRVPPAYLAALVRFAPNAVLVLESSAGRAEEIARMVPGAVLGEVPVYRRGAELLVAGRRIVETLRLADRNRAPALNF